MIPKGNVYQKLLKSYGQLAIQKMVADSPGQMSLKNSAQEVCAWQLYAKIHLKWKPK